MPRPEDVTLAFCTRERPVALGGFDPVLGAGRRLAGAEDLDMFCRVLDDGAHIVYDPTCVVHHVHTRADDAYTALHHGYGLGLGALTAKWVRLRARVGVRLFAIVTKRTLSRAVHNRHALRRRDADLALFRGFLGGFFAAVRFALDGRVFVDDDPPAPITLGVTMRRGGDE